MLKHECTECGRVLHNEKSKAIHYSRGHSIHRYSGGKGGKSVNRTTRCNNCYALVNKGRKRCGSCGKNPSDLKHNREDVR